MSNQEICCIFCGKPLRVRYEDFSPFESCNCAATKTYYELEHRISDLRKEIESLEAQKMNLIQKSTYMEYITSLEKRLANAKSVYILPCEYNG